MQEIGLGLIGERRLGVMVHAGLVNDMAQVRFISVNYRMAFLVCFAWLALFCGDVLRAEAKGDADLVVIQSQGDFSGFVVKQPLPRPIRVGMRPQDKERMLLGAQSHGIIGREDGFRLWFPPLSQFTWGAPYAQHLKLDKGVLQLEFPELKKGSASDLSASSYFRVELPHGVIVVSEAAKYIALRRRDDAVILKVEKGKVQVEQKRNITDVLEPQKVIIDEHGVRIIDEPLLEKSRAIFDFTEKPNAIEVAVKESEKSEGDLMIKSDEIDDIVVRGKASNAKLVEGSGDGEGEYKWFAGSNLIYFILPLLLIAALVAVKKLRKNSEEDGVASEKNEKDKGYENDDIEVIRSDITINDPPLVTKKETHILGDVEDGVEIKTAHPLRIVGCMQGATLISSSHVIIESGVNGQGKAVLKVMGDLTASYLSEAKIACGGRVKVEKAIRNCQMAVQGDVEVVRKNILGGWISSHQVITTPELGSDFAETEVILGRPAMEVWHEREEEELNWKLESHDGVDAADFNKKSSLRVLDEWISALLVHGQAKLDQKKEMPGPVESKLDPTDSSKLQLQGFRREESP